MILGLLGFAVANAASVLGAAALLGRVRSGVPDLDLLQFLLLRLLLISAAVLAAGVLGALTGIGLGVPAAIALVAAVALRRRIPLCFPELPKLGRLAPWIAGLILLRLALQVWFIPPHLGDPLAYHLPKIAEWVRAGAFTREMGMHPHAPFPAGFELIEAWWVVFLRHDVLLEAAGVEFLLVAFAGAMSLARRLGAGDRAAAFAGLLFALAPSLHLSATSALNDTPASALIVASFAMAAGRTPLPLLLVVVGLGLGIKPTYGFALPGLLLLVVLRRHEPLPPGPRPAARVALAATALAVGGFWYARNLIWYGNPFHPLGSAGFVDPTPVQFGPRGTSLAQNLFNLFDLRIYDAATLYGANADYMTGWGPAAFALGGVAFPLTMIADRRRRDVALSFLVSLIVTLTLIQNDPFCLKYVSWFPAILCVSTVLLAEARPDFRVLAAATALFSFAGTFLSYDFRPQHLRTAAAQPWRQRSAAVFAHGRLTREIPEDEVGYFGGPTGASYLLYRPDFSRRVVYLRSTSAVDLVATMKREGLKTLFAPKPTAEQAEILRRGVEAGALRRTDEGFYGLP